MNNEQSSIVDKIVTYSVTKEKTAKGRVLDKIDMKDKPGEDQFSVTGYLIEDMSTGKVHSIAYWRLLEVEDNSIPKGELKGGFNRALRKQN